MGNLTRRSVSCTDSRSLKLFSRRERAHGLVRGERTGKERCLCHFDIFECILSLSLI